MLDVLVLYLDRASQFIASLVSKAHIAFDPLRRAPLLHLRLRRPLLFPRRLEPAIRASSQIPRLRCLRCRFILLQPDRLLFGIAV